MVDLLKALMVKIIDVDEFAGEFLERLKAHLEEGRSARSFEMTEDEMDLLKEILATINNYPLPSTHFPLLLEVKVHKGNRADLGRPTTTPIQNKEALMNFLEK